MKDQIIKGMVDRLRKDADLLSRQFKGIGRVQTRHAVIDSLLPQELALRVYHAFPNLDDMRLMSSFRERKYTSKAIDRLDPVVGHVTFALQAPEVIEAVAEITGFRDLEGDPMLYAGGISAMVRGHYLNPHIDNSHDSARKRYRSLNLLYYMTPDWSAANGGSLELWDTRVRNAVEIPSLFNRLVIMETNHYSWHSVNPVLGEGPRCCVSNYYFSPHSPAGKEYFHITAFSGRPDQPFRRLLSRVDNSARTLLRKVARGGLGKTDLHRHGNAK